MTTKKIKTKEFEISDWFSKKTKLPIRFGAEIIEDRPKAILIKYKNNKIWIPRSQIKACGNNVYQKELNYYDKY